MSGASRHIPIRMRGQWAVHLCGPQNVPDFDSMSSHRLLLWSWSLVIAVMSACWLFACASAEVAKVGTRYN
jgi:hypothetical protein